MLDTILPMLIINRAAASGNANLRSNIQPEAHKERSRRPVVSRDMPVPVLKSNPESAEPSFSDDWALSVRFRFVVAPFRRF